MVISPASPSPIELASTEEFNSGDSPIRDKLVVAILILPALPVPSAWT